MKAELKVMRKNIILGVGDSYKLEYKYTPEGYEEGINWKSSDSNIAEVDENGVVTGCSIGNCKVKVSASGGVYSVCDVQVMSDEEMGNYTSVAELYDKVKITALSSYLNWNNLTKQNDDWHHHYPYIEDNFLFVEVYSARFYDTFSWNDLNGNGYSEGYASLYNSFERFVPCRVLYGTRDVWTEEETHFTIAVSLEKLMIERPGLVFFKLGAIDSGGKPFDIRCRIAINW